ncbi:uncharacterized protein EI90DRAFT_45518 [Cantharellus anzutake]|uniref:uncharacterized protein n=1 Tax=Cantharellus anzutake TaxID=1750568 RepID=UPI0019070B52|nr:uncharacterized protein EI90DRAFT_45518 [Cantharellus anzutake]KAF8344088.1 hypothetical protein EI90DRAFT_45518 [Cantharellus anzutake]
MLEANEEEEEERRRSGEGNVQRAKDAKIPVKASPKSGEPVTEKPKKQPTPPASQLQQPESSRTHPSPSSASPSQPLTTRPGKKSVSFAEPEQADERPSPNNGTESWGDVVPARLKDVKPTAVQPMQMNVVERTSKSVIPPQPGSTRRIARIIQTPTADSDDDDDDEDHLLDSSASNDSSGSEEEDPDDEDGDDFNELRMQADISMEYFRQQGMLKGLSQTIPPPDPRPTQKLGDWDQPYVPLEANRASTKARPSSMSRFKAERTAGDPTPSDPRLASAIRFGKFEKGQLVTRDDEVSGDEDDLDALDKRSGGIIERILKGDPTLYEDDGGSGSAELNSGSPAGESQQANVVESKTGLPAVPITVTRPSESTVASITESSTSEVVDRLAPSPSASISGSRLKTSKPSASTASRTAKPAIGNATDKRSLAVPSPVSKSTRVTTPSLGRLSSGPTNVPAAFYDPAGGFTSVILTPEQAALPGSAMPPPENPTNTSAASFPGRRISTMSAAVVESVSSHNRQDARAGPRKTGERISRFKAERM